MKGRRATLVLCGPEEGQCWLGSDILTLELLISPPEALVPMSRHSHAHNKAPGAPGSGVAVGVENAGLPPCGDRVGQGAAHTVLRPMDSEQGAQRVSVLQEDVGGQRAQHTGQQEDMRARSDPVSPTVPPIALLTPPLSLQEDPQTARCITPHQTGKQLGQVTPSSK